VTSLRQALFESSGTIDDVTLVTPGCAASASSILL
jgi:hypothetical protein